MEEHEQHTDGYVAGCDLCETNALDNLEDELGKDVSAICERLRAYGLSDLARTYADYN